MHGLMEGNPFKSQEQVDTKKLSTNRSNTKVDFLALYDLKY